MLVLFRVELRSSEQTTEEHTIGASGLLVHRGGGGVIMLHDERAA